MINFLTKIYCFPTHALHHMHRKKVSFELCLLALPIFLQLLKPTLKLIFDIPILIKLMGNWDLKRAPDRLKLQNVHFNSGPSDVQLTLDAL